MSGRFHSLRCRPGMIFVFLVLDGSMQFGTRCETISQCDGNLAASTSSKACANT
jgi:hypothetical protein